MTKAQRDAWVEALRSGKYKQGRDHLRTGDAYCCLGVLCDLLAPDLWTELGNTGLFYHDRQSELPRGEPGGLKKAFQNQIAKLNDDEKLSFNEIAEWIEANVPVED